MKSLRWRMALWFAFSVMAVLAVFVGITHVHLRHELHLEKWERSHPDNTPFLLHATYSDPEVDDITGELAEISLLYALPVALLAVGIGYLLARRAFEPVADMNRQLRAIGARSLEQRVRLHDADAEFRSIEENLNALLARLDDSFRQLTEFSAKVAHELRTPLTLIRLQLEEAAGRIEPGLAESLQDIREEEDRQATAKKEMKDTLESLQKEADRLSAIVRDGREDRTVAVRIDHDEARLMVHKTRLDTGELIASRAMTEEERQRALPFSRKVN